MVDNLQIDAMAGVESEVVIDPELYHRLREAVVEGDEDKVRGLLQKFSRDKARNILQHRCSSENEVPLLIVAIRHRQLHLVQLFVDHYHITVDRTDNIQSPEDSEIATEPECSPLLESILVGCPKILDIVCKKVRDIDSEYPVHLACQRQTPEARKILAILLRNGADVNRRDNRGLTPLITACQYGNTGMAHKLLRNGASLNLCSTDGNTALNCLIEQRDDDKKSKQKTFRRLSKVPLQHGMEQKRNADGLTPVWLECLKGNTYMVVILLENPSVNDRERANCLELLASSVHLTALRLASENTKTRRISFTTHMEEFALGNSDRERAHSSRPLKKSVFLKKKISYELLLQAMELRHSHDPPLWKCRKPDGLEAILSRVEAQTSEELLHANKKNFEELDDELLLARHRILDEALYNDYLIPFIGQYICYKTKACGRLDMSAMLALLLYAFKLQEQSPVPPSSDMLMDRITWIDKVCRHVDVEGTVNMSVFGGILDSIEEFYRCRNTEKVWLAKETYVLLLKFLHRFVMDQCTGNEKCIYSEAMTKRFLRLTKTSLESNEIDWHFRPMLVPGDTMLHIACRDILHLLQDTTLDVSYKARDGLAELIKLLHACGEDVNAQNSGGQTPLHVFLWDLVPSERVITINEYELQRRDKTRINFAPAVVHSLLVEGANPNLRDKSTGTSLHAAMNVYAYPFEAVWQMDSYEGGWSAIVELLMKSGANPNAIDSRGFTPLHVLMDNVFHEGRGYDANVTNSGDIFEYHRQLLHVIVRTVLRYGGCANAVSNDGRTVMDMCMDEDMKEEMTQNIRVTRVHLTLSHLAAAAVRKHQVQYHDKLPTRLIKLIELND